MLQHYLLLFVFFGLHPFSAAIIEDEIKQLPGWQSSLPSQQYSGLLELPNTNPKRVYHYWFVQSQSSRNQDPYGDPFIVWYNGGPGASSLEAYFIEMGTFHLNDCSLTQNVTRFPQLWYNQYTWSTFANMLYIESPAGVGFSYCTKGEIPDPLACPEWNDSLTAKDNYAVLVEFFKLFPEYADNQQFYIMGESYAGVYIPTLIMEIEANHNEGIPDLKGFAIGNGCMGTHLEVEVKIAVNFDGLTFVCDFTLTKHRIGGQGGCDDDLIGNEILFMFGHGQISTKLFNTANAICGDSTFHGNWTKVPECDAIVARGLRRIGGYYVYDLYDDCYLKDDGHRFQSKLSEDNDYDYNSQYACGYKVFHQYLNMKEVKEAIHVLREMVWKQMPFGYNQTQTDLRPWYKQKIDEGKYRILVYNGDVDTAVPTIGADQWTSELGYPVLSGEEWRPWTTDGAMDMGGYVTVFDTKKNFTFATVRGAGHMVPLYKPRQAHAMIKHFLQGQPLLRFRFSE